MTNTAQGATDQTITHIVGREPSLSARQMVDHLVPPPQFDNASFDTYIPDEAFPSQAAALESMRNFASSWKPTGFKLFSKKQSQKPGIYLDGGFGVGKTHLLASLFAAAPGPKYFGTFIEYTALVGALGYKEAVAALKGAHLLCIDEFELDDPGDTMVMTRLLGELVAGGTRIAATSNTPPNALGEGRFAAQDFLREITAIADRFNILRIDGNDYRQRDISGNAITVPAEEIDARISQLHGVVSVDEFSDVIEHLQRVHPSKFVRVIEGIDTVVLKDVVQLQGQHDALRLVAFIDRLYDAGLPIVQSGISLDQVFSQDMLNGGYRKKYLRSVSRMIALTSETPR
ncbi:cell division protein ZapE [Humidisolicoccus flavus]|uniref:cell division protein ZapE n=1 Tax=Humidisolicoccus flavus TaxID=3111414 RepID=UPI0032544D26